MTTNNLRRVTLDDALTETDRLSFDRAYPRRAASVTLAYHGVAVNIVLNDADAATVEKVIDSMLAREGWDAPQVAAPAANGKPSAPKADTVRYDTDGHPVCTTHNRRMRESDKAPGTYYCAGKTDDGGYCKSRA